MGLIRFFLGILFVFFVGLFLIWSFSGGPSGSVSVFSGFFSPTLIGPTLPSGRNSDFIAQGTSSATPASESQTRRDIASALSEVRREVVKLEQAIVRAQENERASHLHGLLTLSANSTRTNDPSREYLTITASNKLKEPIQITGLLLASTMTNRSVRIPQGSYLPYSGSVNSTSEIFLHPGGKAIITTARSPIGVSFRLNGCTGYFAQFQQFIPPLDKSCPDVFYEIPPKHNIQHDDVCLDYVDRLPRCTMPTFAPYELSDECREYLFTKINYNTCVDLYKGFPVFLNNNWRVYLGRDDALWKQKREVIELRDTNGKVIDSVSY